MPPAAAASDGPVPVRYDDGAWSIRGLHQVAAPEVLAGARGDEVVVRAYVVKVDDESDCPESGTCPPDERPHAWLIDDPNDRSERRAMLVVDHRHAIPTWDARRWQGAPEVRLETGVRYTFHAKLVPSEGSGFTTGGTFRKRHAVRWSRAMPDARRRSVAQHGPDASEPRGRVSALLRVRRLSIVTCLATSTCRSEGPPPRTTVNRAASGSSGAAPARGNVVTPAASSEDAGSLDRALQHASLKVNLDLDRRVGLTVLDEEVLAAGRDRSRVRQLLALHHLDLNACFHRAAEARGAKLRVQIHYKVTADHASATLVDDSGMAEFASCVRRDAAGLHHPFADLAGVEATVDLELTRTE